MNSLIVIIALLHLLMSIWGVVIASKALHKDSTCRRCFGNCFCGDCCFGGGRGCCEEIGSSRSRYQPIQFVVTHQGTTTMADGQQALVVLLPLTGHMNVQMGASSATVTVNTNAAADEAPEPRDQPVT